MGACSQIRTNSENLTWHHVAITFGDLPAVRTVELVGTNAFVEKLQDFGFTGLREAEDYGPSLALGTADISLWELVNAYRALANTGTWSGLKLTPNQRTMYRLRFSRTVSKSEVQAACLGD